MKQDVVLKPGQDITYVYRNLLIFQFLVNYIIISSWHHGFQIVTLSLLKSSEYYNYHKTNQIGQTE